MLEVEEFPDMLPDTCTMFKKWMWKDETQSLEQISTGLQPPADKQILTYGKTKKGLKAVPGKGINNAIQLKTMTRKSIPPVAVRKPASPNPGLKANKQHNRSILLDDVKRVAFDIMHISEEYEMSLLFEETLRGNQLDDLLSILVIYFKAYFDKVALESKPNVMGYELSSAEKKTCSMVMKQLELSQKMLGEKYCILILGLDTEKQHHMACGKQRKSYTKKDKDFYESLYSYCCLVVWITFRRNDFQLIQEELGRLFRSQAYNPFSRPVDDHEFRLAFELTKLEIQDISLGPKSIRKNKRPPIKSILNQRSPVLVSLFPNSKESALVLLDRHNPLTFNKKKDMNENSIMLDLSLSKLNVGIIGESMSCFNSHTLAPFGDEIDDEKDKRKTSKQVSVNDDDLQLVSTCTNS